MNYQVYKLMSNVYIASGWFNDQQLRRVMTVENILRLKHVNFYSPRLHQRTKDAEFSLGWRRDVFQGNINHMNIADMMIAIYDEEDPGTMMEIGYAFAIGKPIVLVVFNPQPINLMLVEASQRVVNPNQLIYLQLSNLTRISYNGSVK